MAETVKLYNPLGEQVYTLTILKTLHLGERTRILSVRNPKIPDETIVLKLFALQEDYEKEHTILNRLRCELSTSPKDTYAFSLGHPMFYDIVRANIKEEPFDCIVFSYYRYTLQRFMLRFASPSETKRLVVSFLPWLYKNLQRLLAILMRLRLVHADLKPGNLFIDIRENPQTKRPQLKGLILNDFEFAQFIPMDSTGLTLPEPIGTPVYMSPNMIKYHQMDFNTDRWSVACILINALTLHTNKTGARYLHLFGSKTTPLPELFYRIPSIPDNICSYIQTRLTQKDATELNQLIHKIDELYAKSCNDVLSCLMEDAPSSPSNFGEWIFLNPSQKPAGYDDVIAFIFQTVLYYASSKECRELLNPEETYEDDFHPEEQMGGRRRFRGMRRLRKKHDAYLQQYENDRNLRD